MDAASSPSDPERTETVTASPLTTRIRNYFLTGLVLAAPLAITIYVIRWMVLWIDGWVKPLIPDSYNPDTYLPFPVPGFGAIIAFVFITLLGFLTANLIGRRLVLYGETVLGRMPLVRTIYGGLKQIFETVLSNRAASFQEVVLIEYPRRGLWAIAFVATTTKGEVRQKLAAREQDDDEIVSVFMPTTPNPTSGFLLFVKRGEIIELDMTVEEAAKLVISAGLVTPEEKDRLVARRKRRPQLQPQREPAAGGQ